MPVSKRHELEIVIRPSGEIEVEVKGLKGQACLEPMKIFQENVGRVKSRRLTAEYYAPEPSVHVADQKQVRSKTR